VSAKIPWLLLLFYIGNSYQVLPTAVVL